MFRSGEIPLSSQNPGRVSQRIGVAKENDIEPLTPEHASRGACRALSMGTVQHLDGNPAYRWCRSNCGRLRLRFGSQQETATGREQHQGSA
jgi:hypothetical protein